MALPVDERAVLATGCSTALKLSINRCKVTVPWEQLQRRCGRKCRSSVAWYEERSPKAALDFIEELRKAESE